MATKKKQDPTRRIALKKTSTPKPKTKATIQKTMVTKKSDGTTTRTVGKTKPLRTTPISEREYFKGQAAKKMTPSRKKAQVKPLRERRAIRSK